MTHLTPPAAGWVGRGMGGLRPGLGHPTLMATREGFPVRVRSICIAAHAAALAACGPPPCKEGACPDISGAWSMTLTRSASLSFCPLFSDSQTVSATVTQTPARGPGIALTASAVAFKGTLHEGGLLIATAQAVAESGSGRTERNDRIEATVNAAANGFTGFWRFEYFVASGGSNVTCSDRADLVGRRP